MGKERIPTAAEIRAQIPAARARAEAKRAAGMYATDVWYDLANDRVILALTNGVWVAIATRDIPYLADATPEQLKQVALTPGGSGVCWDALDVDLSIEGLLLDRFGSGGFLAALGRKGGRVRSAAKAKAVRANGAKGGRPRKKRAA